MWSVSLVALLALFVAGSYGEDVGENCPLDWDTNKPEIPAFEKTFVDEPNYITQFLARQFHIFYGRSLINKKTDKLMGLLQSPPYGKYKDHCQAMDGIGRNMFYYGNAILPHYGYIYYGTLGVNLRMASNQDGTKKRYNKFFDKVSLHMNCLSNEADMLVQRMAQWYGELDLNYRFMTVEKQVLATMKSIQTQLEHIDNDDDVIFAPVCQTDEMRKYLRDKLQKFEKKVKKMNMAIDDQQLSNLFNEYAKYGSIATSYYVCLGFEGKLEEEVDDYGIVAIFRQVFNSLMAKEEEREAHFLGKLLPKDQARTLSDLQRYSSMTIPNGSFVNCLGQTEYLNETKVLVTKYCGHRCQELAEKEQKRLSENGTEMCEGREPYNVSCLSCYVAVQSSSKKEIVITNMTNWSMEKSGWTIYLIPDHNPTPNYTAPVIKKEDIQAMLKMNIGFERPPPPYFHVDNFIPRQHYIPPKKRDEIDWYDLAKVFGITFVVASTSMWIFFILNVHGVYAPLMELHWNQQHCEPVQLAAERCERACWRHANVNVQAC